MNPANERELQEKFYSDPAWSIIENKIRSYIEPLLDMTTLEINSDAHHLKSEIRARILAHERLNKFLEDCQIIKGGKATKTSFR